MANEISATSRLRVANGNILIERNVTWAADQANPHFNYTAQNIGTTQEQISILSDVATLGCGFFRNLDATNFVQVGLYISSTFYPFMKLKPGEAAVMRLAPGVSYYAKADTAAVNLEVFVIED